MAEREKDPAMKILVAEGAYPVRLSLASLLEGWGYEVIYAFDGYQAWQLLQTEDAPQIALLDWEMPVLSGAQICRQIRQSENYRDVYLIMLTAQGHELEGGAGLSVGADDFLSKPVDPAELRARLKMAERVMRWEQTLKERMRLCALFTAEVRRLKGLLPICMNCKSIREIQGGWQKPEAYIMHYLGAEFSQRMCPGCFEAQSALRRSLPRV